MTEKQEFLAAVRGEQPERVPVAPLIHSRFAHKMLGRTDWKAVFEVHRMIGSCHHRGPIGVGWHGRMPQGWYLESEVLQQEGPRTTVRNTMRTPRGELTEKVVSGFVPDDPIVATRTEHYVKDPERDWPIWRTWQEKRLEGFSDYEHSGADKAFELMGEQGVPSVGLSAPVAQIGTARGMQGMIYDYLDHPDLMRSVHQVLAEEDQRNLEAFARCRSEVLFYDICWFTGADMGPEMFRRWCLPDVQRAADAVHLKQGKYIGLYTLGRIRPLLPMFVDAGVDYVETFEPNQGDTSLAEAKKLYGDRICLMGNFDCVLLARGNVEDARAETLRCLQEGMQGGGYVLVTADEVPADARLANLKAMVETVREHGRY